MQLELDPLDVSLRDLVESHVADCRQQVVAAHDFLGQERAGLLPVGPREGPFLVTEQLALEQGLR